jgi:primosomal protein N'
MVGVPPQGKPPYAEVAVDAQVGYDRTFTYAIPNGLAVQPGHLVWVPFGPRLAHGIVFGLAHVSPVAETRPIGGLMDDEPLLRPHQLELARWISHHYLAPLYQSASLMLPPGFPAELVCALHLTDKGRGIALGTLPNGPRGCLSTCTSVAPLTRAPLPGP